MAPRATLDVSAPRWSLPTTDGDTIHSDSLRGRVTVLVWIDPTCAEVQTAADGGALRMAERRWMEDSRVEILYVASMAGGGGDWLAPADWKPWLKDMKLRAPVVVDSAQSLAKAWKVRRIPSAGVVDTSGRILWAGPVDAMDSTGEPAVSGAIAKALEGLHAWAPERDPEGGCPLRYLH